MIKAAQLDDLNNIMELIKASVKIMNQEGNCQWDSEYPGEQDITDDINSKTLYIYRESPQEIKGIICLNMTEPAEYAGISWGSKDQALILHRMTVSHRCRKQGIGKILFDFAEKKAKDAGLNYIKTDTYSGNQAMNHILCNLGYQKVGEMEFKNKPHHFNCYEKFIVS